MKTTMKSTLGFLSFVPILFVLAVIAVIRAPSDLFGRVLHASILLVIPVTLILTFYFVYLVTRHTDWQDSRRTKWILLLILWFPLTGPVYWYRHIWTERPPVAT